MALISCQKVRVSFGAQALLDGVTFQIEKGERVGLVGRNGEGKSTLLDVLAGTVEPEEGLVTSAPGLRVGHLPQQVPGGLEGTVHDLIRARMAAPEEDVHRAERIVSLLDLDGSQPFPALSGGQKRRALLARALAAEPDLLLLDEPTNHLDLEGIRWLEDFLVRYPGALLFVTHDRAFLQELATRIVELDRGLLTSWSCDYPTYVKRKEAELALEERAWALEDKELEKEEEWLRQGIKDRRARNQGRVRSLQALRARRRERRERLGRVRMNIQEAERSGSKVITARNLGFDYGGPPVVRNLTTTIYRGDKVGIIGPNGCGKTTLLNLLLGDLQPREGVVEHGVSLAISHFDQHREALPEDRSVVESVEWGSDFLLVDGKRRHVLSYLQDFLFSPHRAREPVSSLSGGERNRLLLARLFARPANVLALDEPTNDLDTETLELLESRLLEFPGTVLVVSHDRTFLDNLCTSTLVFEGGGEVKEYVGGYSDWQRTVQSREEGGSTAGTSTRRRRDRGRSISRAGEGEKENRGLTYREKEEWEALPDRIEEMERELDALHEAMADPQFFRREARDIRNATAEAQRLSEEIERAYDRWAELDQRA